MINKVFYEQIESVALHNHLETTDVKKAVATALSKAIGAEGHKGVIEIIFEDETKKIRVYEYYQVVDNTAEDYEFAPGDVTLEEALKIKSRVKVGSNFKIEFEIKELGRKGVFRFKQVFTQEINNLCRAKALEWFKEKQGELIPAVVEKILDNAIIFNVGYNTTSYMPYDSSIGEKYFEGQNVQVQVNKVEETSKGPKVFVSCDTKERVKLLFEKTIVEVATGVVDVMAIARDPGSRTKIAVKSNNPNVNAKLACVGVGGERIRKINAELNNERIDIFNWDADPVNYIAESLTPASVIAVLPDPETKKCIAIVPDDQFSLAIGKGGQNVRLASQATGWKIDIKDETSAYRDEIKFTPNVHHLV